MTLHKHNYQLLMCLHKDNKYWEKRFNNHPYVRALYKCTICGKRTKGWAPVYELGKSLPKHAIPIYD